MAENKMIAYKGFDKNLCCRGVWYEVGKTHKHRGEVVPCRSGLHACPEPHNVFNFYAPGTSRFCEVEVSGTVVVEGDKVACDTLSCCDWVRFRGGRNSDVGSA